MTVLMWLHFLKEIHLILTVIMWHSTLRFDISIIMPLSCSLNNLKMLEKWKGNVSKHIPIIFREKNLEARLHFWPLFPEKCLYGNFLVFSTPLDFLLSGTLIEASQAYVTLIISQLKCKNSTITSLQLVVSKWAYWHLLHFSVMNTFFINKRNHCCRENRIWKCNGLDYTIGVLTFWNTDLMCCTQILYWEFPHEKIKT